MKILVFNLLSKSEAIDFIKLVREVDMKKVLLIIPAYNEELNILKTYQSILDYNKKHKTNYQAIVINDGSRDRTEEVLEEHQIPHIRLIQNLGIGGAVQTGYKFALKYDYDIAIQFDGDGQHDVNYVKTIVDPILKEEADMVVGSRFVDQTMDNFKSSFLRRVGIRLISKVIKWKTGQEIFDTTSGFRAVNKDIIKMFAHQYPTEYPEPISTVDVLLSGKRVVELPVKMKAREQGKSSISSFKSIYYMINVILSILIMKVRK